MNRNSKLKMDFKSKTNIYEIELKQISTKKKKKKKKLNKKRQHIIIEK